jgi:hypothetical protein
MCATIMYDAVSVDPIHLANYKPQGIASESDTTRAPSVVATMTSFST